MTRHTLILVATLALTGCTDVAANVAIHVAGPVLIEPAIQLGSTNGSTFIPLYSELKDS